VGELEDTLRTLAPSLGELDGEPVALTGGITNRNYRARLGGHDYVVRLHGKDTGLLGIDRDAERMAGEAAAALGVAPAVEAALEEGLVTRFVPCDAVAAEELRERVREIALDLRSIHDSGVVLPVRFWVPDLLERYRGVVDERGGRLPEEYARMSELAGRIARAVPLAEERPCHNDLLPGNLIRARADGRLLIVDWEYAGMGHPVFDLGNLSVNNAFEEATDDRLLAAYDGRPPTDGRRAALKLMRVLSDVREAAWGFVQAAISDLEFDFMAYGSEHAARLREAAEGPAFEEWLAAA
jgi:thiamine kinase-like enzyme